MSETQTDSMFSVREFFSGKGVLLTGSTGLVGKALVEKFLHDLTEVKQVYLLIRPRARAIGSMIDASVRMKEEVFDNIAFNRLRARHGEDFESFYNEKVTCISGDLSHDGLGLEPEAFQQLAQEIDVVIHSAATVNFAELLDVALELNSLGPLRLLKFAKEAKAEAFVQISTAYVCGHRTGDVPERLMEPLEAIDGQLPPDAPRPERFDVEEEIKKLQEQCDRVKADCDSQIVRKGWASDSEEARALRKRALISAGMRRARSLGWNDTYTFTKFMGEQLVKKYRGDVPVVIARPAIIESSLRDPEPGWINDLRVADPLIVGFGKGRLMDFPANPEVVMDLIPTDFVVNAILASAAHMPLNKSTFDLLHIASSSVNPLLFGQMYEIVRDYFQKNPMRDRNGKPVPVPSWNFPTVEGFKRRLQNRYLRPMKVASALVDGPMAIPGTKKLRTRLRSMNVVLDQLLDYVDLYSFYTHLDCRFQTGRTREIMDCMVPEERDLFDFDSSKVRWRHYLQDVHIPGLKRNILRIDPQVEVKKITKTVADSSRRSVTKIHGSPQTIVELAARAADHYGDRTFLAMQGSLGSEISFNALYEEAGRWAKILRAKLDLKREDRVMLWSENSPAWCLGYLAILRAGCTVVPLEKETDATEAERLTYLVGAKAGLVSPKIFETFKKALRHAQNLPPLLSLEGNLDPHPGFAWTHPQASYEKTQCRNPAPNELASILFTSGTTVTPKGVMLTHANFMSNAISVAEMLQPLESDKFLSVLPLHHAFEFVGGFLVPLFGGASIHHIETLRMQEVIEAMKSQGITVVLGVPRLYKLFADGIRARMAESGAAGKITLQVMDSMAGAAEMVGGDQARKRLFSKFHEAFGGKLRLFVSGGASLDPEIFHFFKRLGISIAEGYGLTETAPILTVNPLDGPRPGSAGKPLPGVELRIQLESGKSADGTRDREVGEIMVRGPMVMKGYWQDPEATERAFLDGWFRTGDLGRMAKNGYLYLAGRKDDVIVTDAGMKIYPDELEARFKDLRHVKEYCIFGIPGRLGSGLEVALAAVAVDQRYRQEITDEVEEINKSLPAHQRVIRVDVLEDPLPRTSTNKVQRHVVRTRSQDSATSSSMRLPRVETEASKDQKARVILDQVKRAVVEIIGGDRDEVTPAKNLQVDLGLDSIGRVDLIGKLEMRMNISIRDENLSQVWTVGDLINVVRETTRTTKSVRSKVSASEPIIQEETFSSNLVRGAFHTTAKVLFNTWLSIDGAGVENLPSSGSYILASNHSSHLDIVAVRESIGKHADHLHVMAARDYFFDERLKSWFLTSAFNLLPMNRDRISTDDIDRCRKVLKTGKSLLLFPEATRSITGKLQRFKSVIGILAMEINVPIIPVFVSGTYKALPKGNSIPRRADVFVSIGTPVDFGTLRSARAELENEKGKKGRRIPGMTGIYRKAALRVQEEVERLAQNIKEVD